jgi:hypothetical protein
VAANVEDTNVFLGLDTTGLEGAIETLVLLTGQEILANRICSKVINTTLINLALSTFWAAVRKIEMNRIRIG